MGKHQLAWRARPSAPFILVLWPKGQPTSRPQGHKGDSPSSLGDQTLFSLNGPSRARFFPLLLVSLGPSSHPRISP